MPKYKIPPHPTGPAEVSIEEERFPTIFFPASMAQIKSIEVGKEIEVTFRGKAVGIDVSEGTDGPKRSEIRMEIKMSDLYPLKGGDRSGKDEISRNNPGDLIE